MDVRLSTPPSAWQRWGTCTASPAAIKEAKPVDTFDRKYRDEGTIAHELQAICLMLEQSPREYIGQTIDVPDVGPSVIEADMATHIEEAVGYIRDQIPVTWKVHIEADVDIGYLIDGQKGRVDVAAYDESDCTELHILDLKYGRGVIVRAENNGELMLHALGVMRSILSTKQKQQLEKITLHIVQPRANHLDRWSVSKVDLEKFALLVRQKYLETKDPKKRKFVATPEGCTFCPLKPSCRTLRDSIYATALLDPVGMSMEFKDPPEISVEELAEMYEWLDFISAWAGNVKEYMQARALQGVQYPGLKLVEGNRGKREWVSSDDAISYLTEKGMADFEIYEQSLISPAKAESQLGKKNLGERFDDIVKQKQGSPQLVKESDPRPSLNQSRVNEFDDVTTTE